MASETKLQIVIDAVNNATGAFAAIGSDMDAVSKSTKNLRDGMQTLGTIGTVAFAAMSAEVYKSVEAAAESERVQTQLGAVLKSTAGAAGVSSDAAIALSKSLEQTTKFSDETVLSVENMLLTFTQIHKDVFPQATTVVLDMATALGEDTKDAAIQLGKALQDPILGVTALRRVGVSFTDQQQAQIKALVESGHQLEAQKFILHELAVEFGGSATAAAGTFGGQVAQLRNQLDDMQEEIGNAVMPALRQLVEAIAPVIERVAEWAKAHPKLTEAIIFGTLAFTALLAVLLPIALALPGLILLFTGLATVFAAVTAISAPLLLAIGAIVAILALLAAKGYLTKEAWQDVWLGIKIITADAANAVIGVVQSMINFVISGVNSAIRAINRVIQAAQKVPGVSKFISSISQISPVSLGTIDTNLIATSDLASRGSSSTNVVQMSGNVFLSNDVATQIGDMILKQLKLSNPV